MSESLWQAVQTEADKRRDEAQTGLSVGHHPASSPVQPEPEPNDSDQNKVRQAESSRELSHVGESVPTSGRPSERLTERRPYDFYRDQVFWLKETKLAIEKRYGKTIPANAIVQLALDLLIEDYKRREDRSKLVLKLVLKET